jgi:hypothetical protein
VRGLRRGICASAVIASALLGAGTASAATPPADVPATFWARPQIMWAVGNGWIGNRLTATFSPGYPATRQGAARVLAMLAYRQNGTPVSATPYDQAVAAGWITAGTGPTGSITQLELDRGVVAVLGLRGSVAQLNGIRAADGWHPFVPNGFGTEQMVKAIGARFNAPWPHDAAETWPGRRSTAPASRSRRTSSATCRRGGGRAPRAYSRRGRRSPPTRRCRRP